VEVAMARSKRPGANLSPVAKDSAGQGATDFDDLLAVIERAKLNAARAVNRELIGLYWSIGEHVSAKTRSGSWGKAVIATFAERVHERFPGISGFSPVNIWRMRTFCEAYAGNELLSPMVKEVSWTNHVLILAGAKTAEAREFYLRLTVANGYSKRELERQIESALFERTMISDASTRELVEHRPALAALRDLTCWSSSTCRSRIRSATFGEPSWPTYASSSWSSARTSPLWARSTACRSATTTTSSTYCS
jgi:predicted nuclease of restriction endonuclease-like (RecB) superfamily